MPAGSALPTPLRPVQPIDFHTKARFPPFVIPANAGTEPLDMAPLPTHPGMQGGATMISFTRTQKGVAGGMAAGFLLTITAFFAPTLPSVPHDPQHQLGLWLACSLLTCVWLLGAVGRLARHRFFTPEDIHGSGITPNSARAALLQAQLQNTLEQSLLTVIAYGAWLWMGPPERLGLVIVFTAFFAAGRLLFLVGYTFGAPARALGFALTFYPTACLYLALLPTALARVLNR